MEWLEHISEELALCSMVKGTKMSEYPVREYIVRETDYPLTGGKQEVVGELIRCRDCTHWQYDSVFKQGWCEGRERNAYDYCSRPGRKEDELQGV